MFLLSSPFNIPVLLASGVYNTESDKLYFLCDKSSNAAINLVCARLGIRNFVIVNNLIFKLVLILIGIARPKLVLGDPRTKWAAHVIRCRLIFETIFVDDGSNTISAFSSNTFISLLHKRRIVFYSIFDIAHSSIVNVLEVVTRILSKNTNLNKALEKKNIILGTVEFDRGHVLEADIIDALRQNKIQNAVYKMHRRESGRLFDALKTSLSLELLDLALPVEFFDLSNISTLVTFGSSCEPLLGVLYPDLKILNLSKILKIPDNERQAAFHGLLERR